MSTFQKIKTIFKWSPAFIGLMLLVGIILIHSYSFLEKNPYTEIWSAQEAHDGTGTTRDNLKYLSSDGVRPGDFYYSYREYCLSKNVDRVYLRRWLEGLEVPNKEVRYAYELQLVLPGSSTKGCHKISLPIEAPSLPSGKYLLRTQVAVHTNFLRTDIVDLSPAKVFISGMTANQRDVLQEKILKDLLEFKRLAINRMGIIDKDLHEIQKDLDVHRRTEPKK